MINQEKTFNPEERKWANENRPKPKLPPKNPNGCYRSTPKKLNDQYKLADEMVEWINNNEDVLDLDRFPLSKHFSPYRFYKIARHNKYFEEALEVARYIISSRIKEGWSSRKMDPKYCQAMLPEFNIAYREWRIAKIAMVIEAQRKSKAPSNITVIVDRIPTTPQVPERRPNE